MILDLAVLVIKESCGVESTTFTGPTAPDGTLDYCPGLLDTIEALDPAQRSALAFVSTPRNQYGGAWVNAQEQR